MRTNWWSARAIGLHVTLAICFPGFLALGWWQLHRALAGNSLSWAYTFEWPLFALYAVFLWWRLVHESPDEQPVSRPRRNRRSERAAARDAVADAELAAYNAYLAALDAEREPEHGPARGHHRN